jgi:hypothetical protein
MRWFRNKSFVVKMVDSNDVDQTEETVVIDVDKTVDKTVQAVLMLMGAYMVMSTAKQFIIGHPNPAQVINTVAPVFNNNNSSNVLLGGPMRKIVHCIETDQYWPSVTAAAKAQDVLLPLMSKHLNGHHDHINEKTFEIVGVAVGNSLA